MHDRTGGEEAFRFACSETYHGDALEIPVTVINGTSAGPRVFLTAAVHGDELDGVKIIQEVAARYEPEDRHGSLVCLHVLIVPGFLAQQRYIPIYGTISDKPEKMVKYENAPPSRGAVARAFW